MALIRLSLYVALVYGFFVLGFPEWSGKIYHVVTLAILMGAVVGMCLLLKVLDLGSTAAKIALEAAFAAVVAAYLGYTMPLKEGKVPFERWAEHRPTRSDARDGLTRLGFDANSKPAAWLIALFPKS